jgi:peptide deformylase
MAERLEVAQVGNPILRQVAQPVYTIDDSIHRLIADLMATLLESNGVGIAAPQAMVSLRLLIVASRPNPRYPSAPEMEPTVMINPRLLSVSEAIEKGWEGCLSVPGIRGWVRAIVRWRLNIPVRMERCSNRF